MRAILLAIFLLLTNNSYASLVELEEAKLLLREAQDGLAKAQLRVTQENIKKGVIHTGKSETVFMFGSDKDVGAKIGMTKKQVYEETYWGKPDLMNSSDDKDIDLEQWVYIETESGTLYFYNKKLIDIQKYKKYY